MYILGLFIWIILLLLLQTTLFPLIFSANIYPQPLLVFVVVSGLLKGPHNGAFLGGTVGLIEDILSFSLMGVNLLSKCLIGFIAGFIEQRFYKKNFFLPLAVVFIATLLNEGLFFLLSDFQISIEWWQGVFVKFIFPLLLYNVLLTPPIYYFLRLYEKAHTEKNRLSL